MIIFFTRITHEIFYHAVKKNDAIFLLKRYGLLRTLWEMTKHNLQSFHKN